VVGATRERGESNSSQPRINKTLAQSDGDVNIRAKPFREEYSERHENLAARQWVVEVTRERGESNSSQPRINKTLACAGGCVKRERSKDSPASLDCGWTVVFQPCGAFFWRFCREG
jgi:hypothetical protein